MEPIKNSTCYQEGYQYGLSGRSHDENHYDGIHQYTAFRWWNRGYIDGVTDILNKRNRIYGKCQNNT